MRVSSEINGKKWPMGEKRPLLIVIDNGFSFGFDKDGKSAAPDTAILDTARGPKAIDFTPTVGSLKGQTYPGIYKIEGDRLTLCLSVAPGSKRPNRFATAGTEWVLDVYERPKPNPK